MRSILLSVFLTLFAFSLWPSSIPHTVAASVQRLPAAIAPTIRILTTREGLAGNYVTALAEAPDGTLWVGTTNGLTRVQDGHWTAFTHLHGLGADWVTAIAIAPDGHVWFGTFGGGVSVFEGQQFITYNLDNSPIPGNFVSALAVDPGGNVWIGTLNAGVASLTPSFPASQRQPPERAQPGDRWHSYGLENNSVTSLAIEGTSTPWIGTDGGGAFHLEGSGWIRADVPGSGRIQTIENLLGNIYVTTYDGRFQLDSGDWKATSISSQRKQAAEALGIDPDGITSLVADASGRILAGTPRGLGVITPAESSILRTPDPLPVILVHGWTVADSDEFQDSEFRYFKTYAEQDGIPVFYARGISPKNTLFQNAARLRDDIREVKQSTGAGKVNLIGFSMGGLNARAYLESSYYAHDVNRVIILGTPQAGVDIWKPFLAEQILAKPDEPSAIELTPEYSQLLNATQSPRASLPYDLLAGDAVKQSPLQFLKGMPESDGLIGMDSALALTGPNVRHALNSDLHAFEPAPVPFHLTAYLYPADTYARYLRNALRDSTNAPLGSEVKTSAPPPAAPEKVIGNHTPVVTASVAPGQTITRTVMLDADRRARFLAYFPGGKVDFSIQGPDGQVLHATDSSNARQALGQETKGFVSLQADIASFSGYAVDKPAPGRWALIIKRTDKGDEPLDVTTYVDLDSDRRLVASIDTPVASAGSAIIRARLLGPDTQARISARVAVPSAQPGGSFTFVDVPQTLTADGTYTGSFLPARPGYYLARIRAAGQGFERETELVTPISPGGARLDGNATAEVDRSSTGGIAQIILHVQIETSRAGPYAVSATFRGPSGKTAARQISPVDLRAGMNEVILTLDGADLSGTGPYAVDLALLDTQWAAIQIDGASNVASIQP